jgi:hypothetical protein
VFETDRGNRRLPAWAFRLRDVARPAFVLALDGSSVFTPPNPREFTHGVSPFEEDRATGAARGQSLELSFGGGPAGDRPCDISYTVGTSADERAVAFWITPHPVKSNAACALPGYERTVRIQLKEPIGARVLIDGTDGGPVAVVTR